MENFISAISIHASREGSDPALPTYLPGNRRFQSTLPAREATASLDASSARCDFNPRFPRGKRRKSSGPREWKKIFQSTLPAREATYHHFSKPQKDAKFQSTLPAREATDAESSLSILYGISIHASREGSDVLLLRSLPVHIRISIHASREGSDTACYAVPKSYSKFQSTLPAREATTSVGYKWADVYNFNPRFPRGKRLP